MAKAGSSERSGVSAKWFRRFKNKSWVERAPGSERFAEDWTFTTGELDYFIEHGRCKDRWQPDKPDKRPDNRKLWRDAEYSVASMSRLYLDQFEAAAAEGRFDMQAAVFAFSACYLRLVLNAEQGRPGWQNWRNCLVIALGCVLGCREESTAAIRLWLDENRAEIALYDSEKEDCGDLLNLFPFTTFIACILSEYLGEPPYIPAGRTFEHPALLALLERWRDPDPAVIAPLCLGVCDLHTQQKDAKYETDFGNEFMYVPIEILLLFRVRQWLGLRNPVLDHPIMSPPFHELPPEMPFEYSDLIRRVREKLISKGFDENEIVARRLREGFRRYDPNE